VYPGAFHDFDVPDLPVQALAGVKSSDTFTGKATVGTDPQARAEAQARVLAVLEEALGPFGRSEGSGAAPRPTGR
jgi:dienelactone hydrolase